ncbi:type II secretion system protein [Janthinobacterium sp. SUN118]|uniref:type II secretion system protein n=1 Tax=Janthinobacterium sp. SUN118 TaxID=3004100 RepID=UPI0025B1F064|nr:type II secretion system protein [Janthinobacterium sp. SUN118]MDN2709878.1 type II secretion system protein [Janthinobacterium sp. SUN118]
MIGNALRRPPLPNCAGFTYLALLFAVSIAGLVLAGGGVLWSHAQQREKEGELLFVGNEFRRAIGAYYEKTPGTLKRYPATFDDLMEDRRFAATTRHLRRIYADPMTSRSEWGIVTGPDGGIMGVYSMSAGTTIKRSGFRQRDAGFEMAENYGEWRFVYESPAVIVDKTDVMKK